MSCSITYICDVSISQVQPDSSVVPHTLGAFKNDEPGKRSVLTRTQKPGKHHVATNFMKLALFYCIISLISLYI